MLCHCSLLLLSFFLTCKVLSLTSSRNTRQIPIKKITDKASLTNLTSVKKRQSISQSLFSFCLVCTRFDLVSYETCTIPIIGSFGVATCYGKSLLCKLIISKEVVIQLSFLIYLSTAAILLGISAGEILLTIFLFHSILQILLHRMLGYIIL